MLIKKIMSAALILLFSVSTQFGSRLITYYNSSRVTLTDTCDYTQTETGGTLCYLDLITIAAKNTLGEISETFLNHVKLVIKQQDADPLWKMNPNEQHSFCSLLNRVQGYSVAGSHRFKQPNPKKPCHENALLETDLNCAVAILQAITHLAKQRFYLSEK